MSVVELKKAPRSKALAVEQSQSLLMGCRVPKDFFVTTGKGESDITIHAGSYHLALKQAGIEMCNIMCYSSILPAVATEIEKPKELLHGQVMETITAVSHSEDGSRATAGITYGWLIDKETGEKFGGLVCEHNGSYTIEEIQERLQASLEELYYNGFSERFDLRDIRVITETIEPKKKYGTALVALCFTNYLFPVQKLGNN